MFPLRATLGDDDMRPSGSEAPPASPRSRLLNSAARRAHDGRTTRPGDQRLFRLSGNLDIYTVPRFVRQIEFFDPASDQLLVNLADVRLLDSAGICALVSLRNRTHRAGRRFGLVGSSPRMRRLLGYAGLDSAFTFGEDRTTVPPCPAPRPC